MHQPLPPRPPSPASALGAELIKHGWKTQLKVAVGHVPCLFVQNPVPGASALAEHIYAAPKADTWWFWWSWAEPISDIPAETASTIVRVLRAAVTP